MNHRPLITAYSSARPKKGLAVVKGKGTHETERAIKVRERLTALQAGMNQGGYGLTRRYPIANAHGPADPGSANWTLSIDMHFCIMTIPGSGVSCRSQGGCDL